MNTTDAFEMLINYDERAKLDGPAYSPANDILVVPFWTEEFCKAVCIVSDLMDEYKPYGGDVDSGYAPGQEIRLNRISPLFFENYTRDWDERLHKKIGNFYDNPCRIQGHRMPFILKYTMDTQRSMDQHTDTSFITTTMILNDSSEYEGSALTFPRQKWDTSNIPAGHAVIFPGLITHPHYGSELTKGERYTFVHWTRGPIFPKAEDD